MITDAEIGRINRIKNWLRVKDGILIARDDFDAFSVGALVYMVKRISDIFEKKFGVLTIYSLKIVNKRNVSPGPTAYIDDGIINLNVGGNYPSKFIYQLAHEMCHYYFFRKYDLPEKFAWFEETICELASELILYLFPKTWFGEELFASYSNKAALEDYLADIIYSNKDDMRGRVTRFESIEKYLEKNAYDRDINTYFAIKIFIEIRKSRLQPFFDGLRELSYNMCTKSTLGFKQHIDNLSGNIKDIFMRTFA